MKILHINTHVGGGAAISAIRLHKALLVVGADSSFLSLQPASGIPHATSYSAFATGQGIASKLTLRAKEYLYQQKLNKVLAGHTHHLEVFSLPQSPYQLNQLPAVQQADVVVLHWVAGFVDYKNFFTGINKPVIWMMHDMFPFTGGCHYAGACRLYTSACEVCPQLQGTANPAYTHKAWHYQQQALAHINSLNIVAPSQWLMNCSAESSLFKGRPHHHIPYSVDETVFKPIDQRLAREVLNLPHDKKIILFVAENVNNQRKGFQLLQEALQYLPKNDEWMVCTMGNPITNTPGQYPIKQLGVVRDELLLGLVYAAADVFVIPSLEDNLPNTVVEALMCGTPAIGFRIGGVQELIKDGENGYLCNEISGKALGEKINRFLAQPQGFDRAAVGQLAAAQYAIPVQGNRFITLVENILGRD